VKAVDKSLKKEGASIQKYNPFFFKRFSALLTALKYKIISWEWYDDSFQNLIGKSKDLELLLPNNSN
jgi:uncharacterized membrane protein